jgi:hypothetical protein
LQIKEINELKGFSMFVSQNCKITVDWGDGQSEIFTYKNGEL